MRPLESEPSRVQVGNEVGFPPIRVRLKLLIAGSNSKITVVTGLLPRTFRTRV
jgi:hypothetical protein